MRYDGNQAYEVNKDLNTRENDRDTMGIRCQVNKEQNTQKKSKIKWETGVK